MPRVSVRASMALARLPDARDRLPCQGHITSWTILSPSSSPWHTPVGDRVTEGDASVTDIDLIREKTREDRTRWKPGAALLVRTRVGRP